MDDNVHWLFEAQKSTEFSSFLNLVTESEIDGEPKFAHKTCRELARILVCRSYAPAILELCHLIVIANSCGPTNRQNRVENFFWGSGLARPSNFRAYIQNSLQQSDWLLPYFALVDTGVDINSSDITFNVSFSRMPLLVALMDFLTSALGYLELDEVIQQVIHDHPSKQTISDCANKLSKKLYDFLKLHLPTAQEQRKFHRLINFLKDNHSTGFDHNTINDELLLNFWKQQSLLDAKDGLDFKTFPTVYKLFVHLRNTLEHIETLRGIKNARTIGNNRDSDEIDPDEVLRIVETIDTPTNPLHELQSPPAKEIKFLNSKEQARLERVSESGRTANPLALSLLRCEVFDPLRKCLTQALRDKATSNKILEIIEDYNTNSYLERIDIFSKDLEHSRRALMASAHVLITSKHNDAISLALELQPNLNLSALSTNGDKTSLEAIKTNFFQYACHKSTQQNPLVDLAKNAHTAFKKIARKGFKEDLEQPTTINGFVSGSNSLNRLRKQLEAFLHTLEVQPPPKGDWQQQYTKDKEIFSKQFHILYCGADSTQ